MPELPEVQTVRETLKLSILNEKIEDVIVSWDNIIDDDTNYFKSIVINQTINDIERYGKFLVFILDTDVIISHLRMEGKYYLDDDDSINYKHVHVVFKLSNNKEVGTTSSRETQSVSYKQLIYHDTRKFGKFKVLSKKDYLNLPPLSNLAKEPWDIDKEAFYQRVHKINRPIKQVLLDQQIIAGLGNIYANEVCFKIKVHPETKMSSLTKEQIEAIIEASKEVLDKAIASGGTTIRSYTSSLGVTGRFQLQLAVHSKANEPCPICETAIEKMKIGGRMAYFCPKCQKLC